MEKTVGKLRIIAVSKEKVFKAVLNSVLQFCQLFLKRHTTQ